MGSCPQVLWSEPPPLISPWGRLRPRPRDGAGGSFGRAADPLCGFVLQTPTRALLAAGAQMPGVRSAGAPRQTSGRTGIYASPSSLLPGTRLNVAPLPRPPHTRWAGVKKELTGPCRLLLCQAGPLPEPGTEQFVSDGDQSQCPSAPTRVS